MKKFILTIKGKEFKGKCIDINTLPALIPQYELIYVDEEDNKVKTLILTKTQLLSIEVID